MSERWDGRGDVVVVTIRLHGGEPSDLHRDHGRSKDDWEDVFGAPEILTQKKQHPCASALRSCVTPSMNICKQHSNMNMVQPVI